MEKNGFFEQTEQQIQKFFHGGTEVLRFQAQLPRAHTRAAQHVRALCEELRGFAERELLPLAAGELESAVREGRGYTFLPHRYCVTLKVCPTRRRVCVELAATHTQGDSVRSHRGMRMLWSPDGALQRKR